MVLSKHKIEKIRELKRQKAKYREIKAKTGASFDAISKYTKDIQSPSPSSTAPETDKTPRVLQGQTKQIIDKVSTTDEDKQHQTTNTSPDPNYQRLEQMIKDSDHARQTQQQTTGLQIQNVTKIVNQLAQSKQTQEKKEPQPEKPDDPRDINELKHQEIIAKSLPTPTPKVQLPKKNQDQTDAPPQKTKIDPPFYLDPDVEQTSEVDFDQTDELPQERKREYFEVQPYHIKAGLEIWREIKKQYNVYKRYQQTGVYIKLPTKENEKIKEPEIREMIPILSLAPIPSKIPPLSPQTKNESKKEPHSNSDSENSKKSSNDEVNTNKDQTPSKKTNSDA